MSNNPTPPRIERETIAKAHIKRIDASGKNYAAFYPIPVSDEVFQALWTGYAKGAYEEVLRAYPVVEALKLALQGYRENKVLITPEEVETILETYKADV